MTNTSFCESGIAAVGPLPWGTHFCQFYKTRDDLVDTLVPYFSAGLRNNEACLWVTSEPFVAREAKAAMKGAIPDFERYVESGQIEILDFADWYVALGDVDADQVLEAWVRRQKDAVDQGYNGLRLTGNTFWLERSGWNDFMEYERKVNESFWKFRILGLCTYSLNRCGADEVIDVVRNHRFALTLRQGEWEVVESSSLKVAKEELHRLNQELEVRVLQRTAELERALRGREEYMAVLAHELRNPLGAISNAVTVLEQATPETAAHRRALEVAKRQIRHQTRMVDDLLEVSRLTHGTLALRTERLDLTDLCRRTIEDYRNGVEQAGLHLAAALPDETIWVQGDPARLTQVLSNLLDNAAKYTPAGGEVRIELARDDATARAVLTVADTGVGITPDLLPHIFDAFTQAAQTMDRTSGGLGLGLALVKGITELHGGEVRAESAGPGCGAILTVSLPLEAEAIGHPAAAPAPGESAAGLRVLIVEDNQDAAETLRDLLGLWGYGARVSLSGPQGVEAAREYAPHVVLCDLGLPGMDGYEVAQRLRRDPVTRATHLVAVTGYGCEKDRERTAAAGFEVHLTKPLDTHELRRLLTSIASAGG